MTFKTKRDRFFIYLWIFFLLLINAILLSALLLQPRGATAAFIVISLDLLITASLIWLAMDIRYTFEENQLFLKGGMFRTRIPYTAITKVTRNPNIWYGFRILFSRDAIEVHYRTGTFGSAVISPANQERFIEELQKRNPAIHVEPERRGRHQ